MINATIGLDIVEFVIRIKDCFGISISDKDAERMKTVGDLYSYVRPLVAENASKDCLTAKAFYCLRRMLMEKFGCERKQVVPDAYLCDLFPEETRRQQLRKLGKLFHVTIPPRRLDPNARGIRKLVCILLGIAAIVSFTGPIWMLQVPRALAGWLVFSVVTVCVATLPLMVIGHIMKLRSRYQTIGSLVPVVLEQNFKTFAPQGASDRQVWDSIVSILCGQAGLNRSDITPELRFLDIPGDL